MLLLNIDKSIFQDSYVSGLITGFLTIFIVETWKYLKRVLIRRKFKAVFSKKNTQLNLIVPSFIVRPDLIDLANNNNLVNPQYTLSRQSGGIYSSSKMVGNSDVKALKYLSDEISNRLGYSPQLRLDEDLFNNLDIDFISFGSSNFYCKQIINSVENSFFSLGEEKIKSKVTSKEYTEGEQYDFGIIIKLKNYNFPDRIWIAIVGLSETGTSGSSWYLSKYWKKIQNGAGSSEFALLIQVQKGVDHSARVIEAYYRPGTQLDKLYIH